mmetsp:Transcript_970/g.1405  ORF Transcript_970/g.1405 Transcript_970/m.1405 type:complete len:238 (+) Transcript_970:1638-2351(+)
MLRNGVSGALPYTLPLLHQLHQIFLLVPGAFRFPLWGANLVLAYPFFCFFSPSGPFSSLDDLPRLRFPPFSSSSGSSGLPVPNLAARAAIFSLNVNSLATLVATTFGAPSDLPGITAGSFSIFSASGVELAGFSGCDVSDGVSTCCGLVSAVPSSVSAVEDFTPSAASAVTELCPGLPPSAGSSPVVLVPEGSSTGTVPAISVDAPDASIPNSSSSSFACNLLTKSALSPSVERPRS